MAKLRNSNKESAFRKNLRKLFSGDVLVDMGGGNRKRLDVDSSSKSSTYASYTDKIKRSKRTYLPRLNNSFNRTKLFRKYEQMDRDSIISSALDIYADESTTKNSEGNMLSIKSDNNNIVKHLNVLYYQILNIEFNLWTWIRTMVKYGDCFTYNIVEKNKGIINTHFISNYDIERQEEDDEIKFKLLNGIKINDGNQDRETLYNFEVSHFRLLNDNNYLPYGRSLLEGTRKTWEQLILMEDAMLLHRIMRSPERRKYKIDVSNIPPKDVDAYMEEIINSVKKTPYIDEQTGEYNLRYNLESSIDDIFLPVRGDRSGNEVETLSGLDWNGIDDIEYLKNKMMASLKIPKPFLGYDESVEGKCISPETEIPLINGETKKAKTLIEDYKNNIKNYAYSLDENTGKIVAGEIEWAGYTRLNTQIVRVWLDNGEYLDTTPDHYFLKRNGEWVQAQELQPEDSLMPLYLSNGGYKNHYTTVYNFVNEKYDLVHKNVAEQYELIDNRSKVIHHKDFDSRNNDPDNLDCSMGFYEHRKFHADHMKEMNKSPNMIAWRSSDEFKENCSKAGKIGGKKAGVKLGKWVKENGPSNKKEDVYILCDVCGERVKVDYYRKDSAKTCGRKSCTVEYFSKTKKENILYNQKYHLITFENLIEKSKISNSFKELETNLGVNRRTLNKIFDFYGIVDKYSFIEDYMPLALKNVSFVNNFRQLEYKNHSVSAIEWLDDNMNTCDISVKKYHNFGTKAGVIIHNSTLASMDLRFARTIEYVQRIVESELKKMGVVHLYALGFGAEDVLNFDISLTNPSIIYEQEKVSLLSEKIRLAQDMADSQMFSFKDIYQRVFDMSAEDLEQNKKDIIRDYKFKFRLEQLEREGNDPQETKQSVGTPHDLAMLNYSEPGEPGAPKGGFEDSGRPPEGTKYNTQNHPHGRNSLGKDSYKKVSTRNDRSSKVKHDFKSGKPLALENERIKKENIMEMMFGSKKNKT